MTIEPAKHFFFFGGGGSNCAASKCQVALFPVFFLLNIQIVNISESQYLRINVFASKKNAVFTQFCLVGVYGI